MCFSAGASFGAGIVLTAIGIASIKKTETKAQIAFACIPLIFAAQQITEGFLWLALCHPSYAIFRWPATYLFLFFAQVVWPFWVPYSILRLETVQKRKRFGKILVAIGVPVSLGLTYFLVTYKVEAYLMDHHIFYKQYYPGGIRPYGVLCYMLATIAPPFVSAIKRMWILGALILVSYITTALFYKNHVLSVWCFFASIISIYILVILVKLNRKKYNV
jgi:hypothetical protein